MRGIIIEMTIGEWLRLAKQQVDPLDAELIMLFGLKMALPPQVDRSYLAAHPNVGISQASWECLDAMLKRRAKGEPLAYILGSREFYGRNFQVSPAVLIPRPETEAMIEAVKKLDLPLQPRFLEVGTGSGCIAATLALEFPQAEVVATDISDAALEVARKNVATYGGRVQLLRVDLLDGLDFKQDEYAVLLANLPYVNPEWKWLDRKSLAFEPEQALFVAQENGLGLYRRLLEQLQGRIRNVIFEVDPCQQDALGAMAKDYGYVVQAVDGYAVTLERVASGAGVFE